MAIQTGLVTATDQQAITAQEVIDLKTALALENVTNQVVQDNTNKRSYPLADEQKLATIEANATQNQTDAFLLDRANHSGTQPSTTITNAIAVNNAQGGNVSLNMDIPSEYWNLTSNLLLQTLLINAPLTGFSKVKSIKITTQTGVETLSFPVNWDIYGTFDPTKKNKITIEVSQTAFLTLNVDVFINQPN